MHRCLVGRLHLDDGLIPRTVKLDIIALRGIQKAALDADLSFDLPAAGVSPIKSVAHRRELVSKKDRNTLCAKAREESKNGPLFVDYLRLLRFTSAREKEVRRLT